MVGYLFAGQGSQYIGMGKDLYESFPKAKEIFDKADKALGFSITKLCFEGPQEELTKTLNCQPAILTMTIAAFEAAKNIKPFSHSALDYIAGLSLGEYSALVATEAISFEDAVVLVRNRGKFMEEEAAKKPGKMLSIIGLDLEVVKKICLSTNTEAANMNCPGQTVISGGPKEIEHAQSLAKQEGAKLAVILDVSGAFHSSFMSGASVKLAQILEKTVIKMPQTTVISNVTAKPFLSVEEIKNNLVKQVSSSVLWEDSIRFILGKGVNSFYEFGPGKVLKGLMRRIDPSAQVKNIEKKEDILSLVDSSSQNI